jgi:hypothetical protein
MLPTKICSENISPPLFQPKALAVPMGERWQIHARLQELEISSYCAPDGLLHVEINTPLQLLLVYRILWQATTTRQQWIDWLECCWQMA